MKNLFSTDAPNQTKVAIISFLQGINFFDNSPKPNDEVKRNFFTLQNLICLQLVKYFLNLLGCLGDRRSSGGEEVLLQFLV